MLGTRTGKVLRRSHVLKKLGIVVVGLIVLLLVASLWVDSAASTAVQGAVTGALGVETTLESMDLSIFAGQCAIEGLEIQNPEGFSSPHFLKLGAGEVEANLMSVLGDVVEIPRIALSGIEVSLEHAGGKSNFGTILDHVKKGQKSKDDTGGKGYRIEEIVLEDIKVSTSVSLAGASPVGATLNVPEIRLKNVCHDSDKGALLRDVAGQVVQAVLSGVFECGGAMLPAAIKSGLQGGLAGLDAVPSELVGKISKICDLGGGVDDALKNGADGIKKST